MAATRGWRANQKPTATPPSEPIAKARIDSHSVIARCFQMMPLANQATIWLPTSTGLEKKNGGSSTLPNTGTLASNCHSPTTTTATSNWQARSVRRDMVAIYLKLAGYLCVVPANSGTHTPCNLVLGTGVKASRNHERQG